LERGKEGDVRYKRKKRERKTEM
jgi:hypothetical protein